VQPDLNITVHPFMREWATRFTPDINIDEATTRWASGQDFRAGTATSETHTPTTKAELESWAKALGNEQQVFRPLGMIWTPAARRFFAQVVDGMFPPDDHG
jgi:hypothetical protein